MVAGAVQMVKEVEAFVEKTGWTVWQAPSAPPTAHMSLRSNPAKKSRRYDLTFCKRLKNGSRDFRLQIFKFRSWGSQSNQKKGTADGYC
jgi:hypothetical protein